MTELKELEDKNFRNKIQDVLEDAKLTFLDQFSMDADRCESHVELLFYFACHMKTIGFARSIEPLPYINNIACFVSDLKQRQQSNEYPFFICMSPQVKIGRYRVDFLFGAGLWDNTTKLVVVECDGHDFHERTKEQARADKSRDRFMKRLGIQVFRFTGSEVWRDANYCLHEVLSYMKDENKIAHLRWADQRGIAVDPSYLDFLESRPDIDPEMLARVRKTTEEFFETDFESRKN